MNCLVKTICIYTHHPILLRWFNLQKVEEGEMCYVQDEQNVDKAFWLENFQENILEMRKNKVRTS
jgi:hypothetical protein